MPSGLQNIFWRESRVLDQCIEISKVLKHGDLGYHCPKEWALLKKRLNLKKGNEEHRNFSAATIMSSQYFINSRVKQRLRRPA